jgi:predicted transcriptional regulator of viral defense system
MESRYIYLINKWSKSLDGVFTLSDLAVLFSETSRPNLFKIINKLINENILVSVKRGLYSVPGASLNVISNRICKSSYISMGSVLAENLVIGSVPVRRIQAVKVGPPRKYDFALGKIEHFSIADRLYFGYENKNGFNIALPEKAFLDACYFYYKGKRFSFDLDTDVDLEQMNRSLIQEFLSEYDKRFITFYKSRWKI